MLFETKSVGEFILKILMKVIGKWRYKKIKVRTIIKYMRNYNLIQSNSLSVNEVKQK